MKRILLAAVLSAAAVFLFGCYENRPVEPVGTDVNGADDDAVSSTVLRAAACEENAGVPAWAETYEIVIENLTAQTGDGSSQPFSPPVLATHRDDTRVFRRGTFASVELSQVAEDAVNGPLVDQLTGSRNVYDVVQGDGVILPGAEGRYEIRARRNAGRVSIVFMLVNTNDGFSGADFLRLPPGGSRTYYLDAYDAGSEVNTELVSDIPGPCCGSHHQGPDEHRRIGRHDGIKGTGDLDPADYGWTDPVARLTIERIK